MALRSKLIAIPISVLLKVQWALFADQKSKGFGRKPNVNKRASVVLVRYGAWLGQDMLS
jgi:hypothetical protein